MQSYLLKSLDAVASPGVGAALMFDSPRSFRSAGIQVSFTGSPSTVEMRGEITLDGTNWSPAVNWTAENGQLYGFGAGPMMGIRATLATLTGGSSPTVTAWVGAAPQE